MKILIIGGAGYVGSVLVQEFLKYGHFVRVLDLLRRGSKGIQKHIEERNPNFNLINGDYMNELLPFALKDMEAVIHLAAIVGDKACEENRELATKTNVEGIHYLVEEVNKKNIPLIIASTCSVYGTNPNTCDEKSIVFPISHYAKTKFDMEAIVRGKSKCALIFRFGTMYGWSPNMRYDLVVNRLVHDAVKYKEFRVFGGKQGRPFLHPITLAHFLMDLLKKNNLKHYNGEIYNLVSENYNLEELGELIERQIPNSIMILEREREVERSYICRSFKATRDLGFRAVKIMVDGISEIRKELECQIKEVATSKITNHGS